MSARSKSSAVEQPKRILISRLSAIGDCIHTLPLLSALRRKFPEAKLAWATQPGPAELLRGHPQLDELIIVRRNELRSVTGIFQLRARLAAFGADVSLDPQSLTKSALVARLSGADRRIGLARPFGRELAPWLNNQVIRAEPSHVVQRYLQLLRGLDVVSPEVEFVVPRSAEVDQQAREILRQAHLPPGHYALVNCGAGWPSKIWPAQRFARLARFLGQRYRLPSLVVWHGPEEFRISQDVALRSGGHAVTAPATTLLQLASLCRQARLCVASDTGPLHLAAAVGTACVGLYGPTQPEICGPYGERHEVVESRDKERFRWPKSPQNRSMQDIDVARVCGACERLLASSARRAA
ncbi:MAG: glycosyltransferase family 9 protein [Planctomycetota bacterium]|nr:glycosyltransferase family 9 protein [Planctomycetota bacterium]MDA1177969.1 glycosyltransferase family 9 protein [Planctomycetota bacterium]